MLNKTDVDLLKKSLDFWNELSPEDTELLLANTASVSYIQGESVYSAAQKCLGVLILKSGELRTFILSESGKEITLYRLGAGNVCILSASCLLSQITFDVHIEAEKNSEILLINSAEFSKLIERNIYAENFSLRVAADRFSDVMWTMEQILFMNFDQRLAIFILNETAKTGSDEITLTHEQIAKYMGSAREVVSRMMKYFAKEGYVELQRGTVRILDKPALKKLI